MNREKDGSLVDPLPSYDSFAYAIILLEILTGKSIDEILSEKVVSRRTDLKEFEKSLYEAYSGGIGTLIDDEGPVFGGILKVSCPPVFSLNFAFSPLRRRFAQ